MSDDDPVVRALAARCQHLMVPDQCIICLRRRVAELEATAARRLELLRELRDSFCAAAKLPCREPNVKIIREMGHYLRLLDRVDAEISAAAEVAAGEKTNHSTGGTQ
jgi:hypothetical protein